jgi:hypothetical protein
MYKCTIYNILMQTGKGGGERGGELNQREGERSNRGESQSSVENTNMTECSQEIGYLQSINSD